jgi:hypothetical protein
VQLQGGAIKNDDRLILREDTERSEEIPAGLNWGERREATNPHSMFKLFVTFSIADPDPHPESDP